MGTSLFLHQNRALAPRWHALGLLLCGAALAQAATLTPQQFTFRSGIELRAGQATHQLVLPLAVYEGVNNDDLGDLRVFNGNGDAVPYTLLRQPVAAVPTGKEIPAPLIPASARKSAADAEAGIVFDTSRAPATTGTRRQTLRLELAPGAFGIHGLTLDASDDLRTWRRVRDGAQVAIISKEGQRVERTSVSWDDRGSKYLRLRWNNAPLAPPIKVAMLTTTEPAPAPPLIWSAPLQAVQSGLDHADYALPGRLPLEWLRVALADANDVATVAIQQYQEDPPRSRRDGHWDTLASSTVYRLASPLGELTSPDVSLNLPAIKRLRLAAPARNGVTGAPAVQVGFMPQILVFQAQGPGPYSLMWGAAGITSAAVPPETVLPGYRADHKLDASPATLLPPVAPLPQATTISTPAPLSNADLQVMLLAGLLLAAMAALLFKQRSHKGGPPA